MPLLTMLACAGTRPKQTKVDRIGELTVLKYYVYWSNSKVAKENRRTVFFPVRKILLADQLPFDWLRW